MNFRNISAWSIRNPVVPIVVFLGLVIAGVLAFAGMKVQDMPDIEFPVVIVQINQPGAAPSEIETQVTQRVESAVRTLQGVQSISSTASEGGTFTVVEFKIGEDINQAVNEVKNAVDQIRGELPDGILEPQIFKELTSSEAIAYFAVSADDMTMEQLSWFIDDTVTKKLLGVKGLAEVTRGGGVSREIVVMLDPARMQSLGVTASQVNQVLRQLNLNAAGGKAEIAGSRQSVRVLGNAQNAYELSQTEIALGGGRTVKLADFAAVSDSYGEVTSLGKANGKQVVTFGITRARGESDVEVYDGALAKIAEIEKENPGLSFTRLFTSVDYTKGQYESSIAAMIEGAVLAVIVVFFFLRDWRATVISSIAIPLSAIPSFWFLDQMGITLNTLSLLALGLVAGVLVDDAIVEIENIVRHMRMGKSAYQASIDAADEIGLAVVATTFSIVAVFLPVALMPGVSGQMFRNFGFTVVVSVLMSLAVARTITPMVAAYFLKSHGHAEHGGGVWMDRYIKVLNWSLDSREAKALRAAIAPVKAHWWYYPLWLVAVLAVLACYVGAVVGVVQGFAAIPDLMDWLPSWIPVVLGLLSGFPAAWLVYRALRLVASAVQRGFAVWYHFMDLRYLARLRDHRVWMIGIGAASLATTGILVTSIPSEFFPTSNSDYSLVRIEMVPGTTLQQTEAVADQVTAIVRQRPETETALARINEGNGRVFITLKKDRETTSMDFERELTPQLQKIADARVNFQDMNGPGGGGTGRPISIMLSGSDSQLLDKTAAQLVENLKGIKEVVAPRIAADMRRPELVITPRLDIAASLGVTTAALSQTIRIATIGDIDQNAAKFSLADRQVPIRVRLPESSRRDLATIQNLPVPTSSGGSVPLSRVADISFGSGPVSIQRYNQNRRVFVGADLAPGVVKGTAMDKINALPLMQELPAGVSNAPFGQDEWQQEMIANFQIALMVGVLLVFAVLVLLYHRFVSPLVNMGSLFLAPFGGLIAILLVGQAISMPVFIGVLMLFGIVAKNSILLIDFAIEEMARGAEKFEAIVEAGHKRAQPIVMTTVAMVAGMIPTAVSLGGDGAWRAPMGTVVIGGLIMSTLLTLLIVPAGFSLADGFEKRLGPALRNMFLTYRPEDSIGARYPGQAEPGALPAE
jgi:multidrug efflux pump subunit AcrB